MEGAQAVRVVGFSGSPHRQGNTATLMRWVLEGCQQAGAAVEWLHASSCSQWFCAIRTALPGCCASGSKRGG